MTRLSRWQRLRRWIAYRRMSPELRRLAYVLDEYYAEWNRVLDGMEAQS